MNDPIDLLQIKIEKAKRELPEETLNAIAAVDWRAAILGMRASKGYSFEQLGDLELETELLLCGLLSPENYPKELESRMKISKGQADQLVNEMNDLVFKKIREEIIKNAERKKIFANSKAEPARNAFSIADARPHDSQQRVGQAGEEETNTQVLNSHGIEIIDKPKPAHAGGQETHPILAQKMSGSFQIPMVKTEYSLNNISKTKNEVETQPQQIPHASEASLVKPSLPASVAAKIKPVSSSEAKISKAYSLNEDPYRLSPNE